jgi:hypothetical protein
VAPPGPVLADLRRRPGGRRGQIKYVAACAADDCGWAVEYDDISPAMIAAQGHRCPVR